MVSELAKASVYTDFEGLAELRAAARKDSPEALKAVARQFEALFLDMVLKSMREASEANGGDPLSSDQGLFYRDMYDRQLALTLAQGEGVGLADALVRQLQAQGAASGEKARSFAAPAPAGRSAPRDERADPVAFDSPEAFVRALWPHAKRTAEELGVDPRALVAQAALETGWGRAVIRRPDGSSSYNLFNIKADGRWGGERVSKLTLEFRDGVAHQERAAFRAYGSYAESFADYGAFLRSQPRYREALARGGDPAAFIEALHAAGYATDPRYAEKITEIMGRDLLSA